MKKIFLLIILVICACSKTNNTVSEKNFMEGLKEGNWEKVTHNISADSIPLDPTILDMIKAHVFISQNKNNEALCLLQNNSDSLSLSKWKSWSDSLYNTKSKNNNLKLYFKGDALARMKNFDSALAIFKLEANEKSNQLFALINNAAGTVYAIDTNWNSAIACFDTAYKKQQNFVDAMTNRGFLNLHRKVKATSTYFDSALIYNPDYYIAYMGKTLTKVLDGTAFDTILYDTSIMNNIPDCIQEPVNKVQYHIALLLDQGYNKILNNYPEIKNLLTGTFVKTETGQITPGPQFESTMKSAVDKYGADAIVRTSNVYQNANRFASNFLPKSFEMHHSMTSEFSADASIGKKGFITGEIGGGIKQNITTDFVPENRLDKIDRTASLSMISEHVAQTYGTNPKQTSSMFSPKATAIRNDFDNLYDINQGLRTGGINTRNIGKEGIQKNNWDIEPVYGLLY